ncbi:MAG: hypothetical protein QNK04_32840, partial [Myxococcota bacterium]|nr:hypothetical protein [Myxococcota bacterium]
MGGRSKGKFSPFVVGLLLAEVGSVGQEGVVARLVARRMETQHDSEAGGLRRLLQTEFDATLQVDQIGLEQAVEGLLSRLPHRDVAPVTRRAV